MQVVLDDKSAKFWSTLAKAMHCWRGKMTDVYKVCCDLYNDPAAFSTGADKVPPQPLVGRWGVVLTCIERLLQFDPVRLAKCLRALSSGNTDQQRKSTGIDELSVEEQKHHSEKMGRWKESAVKALESWQFHFSLLLARRLIQGLQHFHNAVLRKPEQTKGETCLSLTRLICGEAENIMLSDLAPLLE